MTRSKRRYLSCLTVFVCAFAIYANTLGHRYALDDKAVLWHNEFVQKGFSGIPDILCYDSWAGLFGKDTRDLEGGRYRPLSLITFAIEVELFGKEITDPAARNVFLGNPAVSHFINVLLYACLCTFLLLVLDKIFRDFRHEYRFLSIPFIATLLFTFHPLHTEIVANIKGRDEILALLFSLAALNAVLDYCDSNRKYKLVLAFVFLFLGAMSKETAITFVAVAPVTIYFFRRQKPKAYIAGTAPLIAGALLYLLIRQAVLGPQTNTEAGLLMNNPFLGLTFSQRYATIALTLLFYIRLILFPHPLTWDYYPYHIPVVGWSDWRVVACIAIHAALAFVAVRGFRKKSTVSYGILLYAITLSITSNVFFNIGAFMSERFVFVSLLGFCIIAAWFIVDVLPRLVARQRLCLTLSLSLVCTVLSLYAVKTVSRNMVWKDDYSLFSHDVHVSQNSAKSNGAWASVLYKYAEDAESKGDTVLMKQYLTQAIPYFRKALDIYPDYSSALVSLGNSYYKMNGDYRTLFKYYIRTLVKSPLDKDVWENTIGVLTYNVDDPEFEKYVWKEYARRSPKMYRSYLELGNLYQYAIPVRNDSAVFYYEKAKALRPDDFDILYNLASAYGKISEFDKAEQNLLAALRIRETAGIYKFLGFIAGNRGDDAKALNYFEKSLRLDPADEEVKSNLAIARSRVAQLSPQ